jgi:hypothetical protein
VPFCDSLKKCFSPTVHLCQRKKSSTCQRWRYSYPMVAVEKIAQGAVSEASELKSRMKTLPADRGLA